MVPAQSLSFVLICTETVAQKETECSAYCLHSQSPLAPSFDASSKRLNPASRGLIVPGTGKWHISPSISNCHQKPLTKIGWLNPVAVWKAWQTWEHAQDFSSPWDCIWNMARSLEVGLQCPKEVTKWRTHWYKTEAIDQRPNPEQCLLL